MQDHNIGWQETVESPLYFFRLQRGVTVKIDHLSPGVDPGVGSTRSPRPHRLPQHDFQPGFKDLLDGQHAMLPLPSMILGAIVLQSQFEVAFKLVLSSWLLALSRWLLALGC